MHRLLEQSRSGMYRGSLLTSMVFALGLVGSTIGSSAMAAAPDLVEMSISNPPANALSGSNFTVTDMVYNQGNATAGTSYSRYYLSGDQVLNTGDTLLGGSRTVKGRYYGLAARSSSTGQAIVTIPVPTPTGNYYLLACADDTNLVAELIETNNCRSSTGLVAVANQAAALPDMVESSVSFSASNATVNVLSYFDVTHLVTNQGTASAAASYSQFYLSADQVKDPTDLLLWGSQLVRGKLSSNYLIPVGQSSGGTVSVQVPVVPAGTYYLFACADDTNQLLESVEGNNCQIAAGTVTVQ